ncbi:peptidoglycan-binding protein [Streptomyces cylindrosporus]|uniref:Peptidoglycan-binding protein n=1 Tax=Streptomyces cylindrosporus TaxID=2927583 RepID=A0ABS9YNU4_9ACTN|nr:peptidoglycan-binding protein [Streptomyces cylindrosporus]MCI3278931.1 peptidoglycan-binding protein [Streptomyces cylindrosporus]
MPRWKVLPAQLDPRVRQLVVRLRRLKDHSGLSLRQLAARTGYSPKSWERYLSGGSLPPREAVEALARIGGEDPTRLLALHEVAAQAWRDGRAEPPDTTAPDALSSGPDEAEIPPHGRALRVAIVAGAVALVLAVSSAVLVAARFMDDDSAATPAAGPLAATAPAATPTYHCRDARTGGRWYAGNSRTLNATVAYGSSGPEVAEVQCLLRRAGISPGGIDGMFGPLTRSAVVRFQKQARLDADGIVGPHTWKALRG